MHFARSIVLGYHSIPKINWGSFRGGREEKWGSFQGKFGDHFGGCKAAKQGVGLMHYQVYRVIMVSEINLVPRSHSVLHWPREIWVRDYSEIYS